MRALALVLVAVSVGCGASQAPVVSPASVADPGAEVRAREDALTTALLARDRAALEAILGGDFELTGAGSPVVQRDAWLTNAVERMEHRRFELTDVRVRALGDVVGVEAGYAWHVVVTFPGKPPIETLLKGALVDSWVRRDGRWQLAWRHVTQTGEELVGAAPSAAPAAPSAP